MRSAGRTKVILDREDNVVLNLGDIITHQASQPTTPAASTACSRPYKANVEFTKDEMRAPDCRGASDGRQVERRRTSRRRPRLRLQARAPG